MVNRVRGRRWVVLAIAAAIFGTYLLVGAPQASADVSACQPSDVHISIMSFFFDPTPKAVPKGSTVCWTNDAPGTPHTTSSDVGNPAGGVWDSGTLTNPGSPSFRFAFNTSGSFPYHCNIHTFMTGTIVVQPDKPIVSGTTPVSGDNDTTPTVNGTAPNNDTVHVFGGSGCATELGTTPANGTGNWSYALTDAQSITSGDTATFFAKAEEGQVLSDCSTASASYTAGTTGPDISIDSGVTGGLTTVGLNPVWTFHSTTPNVTIECSVDQGARSFSACASGQAFGPLTNGAWTFAVKVFETANPTNERIVTVPFTVDPFTKITGPSKTKKRRPTFTVTTHVTPVTVECEFGSSGFFAAAGNVCQPPNRLGFGKHKLTVRATDQFQNVGPETKKTFTIVRP